MPIIKGGCSEFTDVVKSSAVANAGVSAAASGGFVPRSSSGGYVSIAGIGAKVTLSAIAKASSTPSAVATKKYSSSGVVTPSLATLTGFASRLESAPALGGCFGMVYDLSGNIYIADAINHVIRKLSSNGQVTTFCGAEIYATNGARTGSSGYVNGISSVAKFSSPKGITIGPDGLIYVADSVNNRIRRITLDGIVSTYAGSSYGYNVDGSIGESAKFMNPRGLSFDPSGNLYVVNTDSSQILKISPTRVVTLFAGTGNNGSAEGNALTVASFFAPYDVKVGLDGTTIYVADAGNNKIRKIVGGIVSTFASTGISFPIAIAIEPGTGNLLVVNTGNNLLQYITPAGVISLTDEPSRAGGNSVIYGQNGSVYVSYDGGIRIGIPSTQLTTGNTFVNGNVNSFTWTSGNNTTFAIRFNKDRTLMYIVDSYRINKYDISTNILTNVLSDSAQTSIKGICVDSIGNVYYTRNGVAKLYMLTPGGVSSEFCSSFPGFPQNLTIDSNDIIYGIGQLYSNTQIYKVSRLGISTLYSGTGTSSTIDGTLLSASFNYIYDICIDNLGDMYVLQEYCVRKITPTGIVTTFASTHRTSNTNGVDGIGQSAILGGCSSIVCDNNGSLYIGEIDNNPSGIGIRKINTSSALVTTLKRFTGLSTFYSLGMDKYGYLYSTTAWGLPIKIT